MGILRWKVRRELQRIGQQLRGIPEFFSEPAQRRRHDATRPEWLRPVEGEAPLTRKVALLLVYQPQGVSAATRWTCEHLVHKGYAPLVISNAPDLLLAKRIAHVLVEDGLAACVNLLPGMESIYRWQGKVERADELVLIAKLPADGFQALSDRVQALHPYQVPCIIALPVSDGLPAYLAWLAGDGP